MSTQAVVIGSWHLGSVIGTCLAEAGNQVSFWDQSPQVAEKWSKGKPPIFEPGLDELVQKHWGKNIFWCGAGSSKSLKDVAPQADWMVLAYDTPINEQDEVQLASVEEGFDTFVRAGFKDDTCFFFTAQLPVGTSRRFREKVLKARPSWKGFVSYQPENLRLGEAIKCFQSPDRAVLGIDSDDVTTREKAAKRFQEFTKNTHTPLNIMGLESAEMVKHALNSFLATCVVFANEIATLCEKSGADAWDVVASLKQDSRVGPKAFLRPGLGFSGGTLARDVKTLSGLHKTPAENYFSELYKINTQRNDWILDHLHRKLGSLKGKTVALLGVTYKPGTSTVRRSPALDIAALLKAAGAQCLALDPMADLSEYPEKERAQLPFTVGTQAETALRGADAAVLVTEWPQFLEIPWKQMGALMKTKFLIDTKNHFSKTQGLEDFEKVVPGKPVAKS